MKKQETDKEDQEQQGLYCQLNWHMGYLSKYWFSLLGLKKKAFQNVDFFIFLITNDMHTKI